MQFPVPQFTDVEDKIIGGLTLKQFGILFGAGVVVFLGYSASKSVLVVIFLSVLFGVPALVVAFAKINGRPLYKTFPLVIRYFTSAKLFVFKKEATGGRTAKVVKSLPETKPVAKSDPTAQRERLKELQFRLDQSVSEKERLLQKK